MPPKTKVSYPTVAQKERTPMVETATIDGQSVAKPRSAKPATASASELALHLDCSRTYIGKLEAEGVIQRQGDGFPLDHRRVAYLRYLRRERRQSPRSDADADHVKVKTEMLQLRLMEKRRELVRRDAHEAMIDQMAGLVMTKLGGWWFGRLPMAQVRFDTDAVGDAEINHLLTLRSPNDWESPCRPPARRRG
jgi:hypothetical protein